ncbi:hypothetical protein Btru_002970 [Bulinus truncatus]|nr:hypothetical protein Btru_002970 [Bulinus truncatus]
MKSRQASQASPGKAKTSGNIPMKSSLKLRTNAYRPIANRTRDKSPKELKSPSKSRLSKGRPDGGKSKSMNQKQSKDLLREVKNKARVQKSKSIKTKSTKQKDLKEKLKRLTCSNSFLDFWGAKVMGKREASLNATIKVNIMYEKFVPLKSQSKLPAKKADVSIAIDKEIPSNDKSQGKSENIDEKKNKCVKKESLVQKFNENGKSLKVSPSKTIQTAEKSKKRKISDIKCSKDESAAKVRKTTQTKCNAKIVSKKKKKKKPFPSGHQLSNIIEKSPRQASLIAKAMIAMEQEEECVVIESAARTRVFDWTELRPYTQNQQRQIIWQMGLGNKVNKLDAKDTDTLSVEKESDSRFLKEYIRAQKEDFQGLVDVEKCLTPEKAKISSPSPKKVTPVAPIVEEKPDKIASPVKPQSCRVATPIPQLPVGHRTSHMTSYIHHPIPQPVYSQPHAHPQPIKVPPSYTSPAYIYQYAMDRQQGLYVPSNPSPVTFGVSNNDMANDFSSAYTLGPMATLSLRRGSINPYNTSLHLPVQHIAGFNYPSYYSAPLQSMSQQNASAIQALHQRFPLVQPQPVIQALPQEMGTITSYPAGYQPYTQMSSLSQDTGCMPPPPPPPPAHTHRPTSIGPPLSHPPSVSPIESLRSMNPVGIQPIVNSPVLDFTNSTDHQSIRQLAHSSYNKSLYYSSNRNTNSGSPAKYVVSIGGSNIMASCKKERDDYLPSNCDLVHKSTDCSPRVSEARRKSAESSDVSDLLHSAHSAMYQIDNINTSEIHQPMSSVASTSSSGKNSPCKVSMAGQTSFNASYSVSSILDMPSYKIKPEPDHKMYSIAVNNNNNIINNNNNLYCLNRKAVEMPSKANAASISFATSSTEKSTDCLDLKKEISSVTGSQKSAVDQIAATKVQKAPLNYLPIKPQKPNDGPPVKSHKPSVDYITIKAQTSLNCSIVKNQKPSIEYVVIRPPKTVIDSSIVKVQNPQFILSTVKPQKSLLEHTLSTGKKEANSQIVDKAKNITDVIVIEDTDESSDDEPLAKLVKPKASDSSDASVLDKDKAQQQQIPGNSHKIKVKYCKPNELKPKDDIKEVKLKDDSRTKAVKRSDKPSHVISLKIQNKEKILGTSKSLPDPTKKAVVKLKNDIVTTSRSIPSVSVDEVAPDIKSKCSKKVSAIAKSKKLSKRVKEIPELFSIPPPRINANHGWIWVGEGEMRTIPKLTLGREEQVRLRKCYKAMRHSSGEVVSVRDCVILQSDGDGTVPYVARVTCLWENFNGEMMFSMLWYYQPEHTLHGREPEDGDQELFASKHREENSVACIDDKCFVLMFNEYCRLEAEAARIEQGVDLPRWRAQLNTISDEDQKYRRPKPPVNACVDNIWFCRINSFELILNNCMCSI